MPRRSAPTCMAVVAALAAPDGVGASEGAASPAVAQRIVHRFDFDERPAGNLEDVPKYWEPLRPAGFPHFAHGAFDFETGRLGPPSFHLNSEGRNVAYHYAGPETRIRANAEYWIEAFIRPDQLSSARACLSACFVDRHGRPITASLIRSRYVGGADDSGTWVRVEMRLPPPSTEAYAIGVAAWVVQEPIWNARPATKGHIPRNDVFGGAWFDDVTIYAMPRIQMTTSQTANVLIPGGPQELRILLSDADALSLRGRVSIAAADGTLADRQDISVEVGSTPETIRIPVSHLAPGLYHARLDVLAGTSPIASRRLTFARLGERYGNEESLASPFGIVIDARSRAEASTEVALLKQQAVRATKLPVWTGLADDPPTTRQQRAAGRLLQELVAEGFALTGVLAGPPRSIVLGDGAYVRPLLEFLAGDPSAWAEHLAGVVAPHASAFHRWQIGPDIAGRHAPEPSPRQSATAVSQVRDAMRPFVTMPLLGIATSTAMAPAEEKLPAEQITLAVGREVPTDRLASRIDHFEQLGYPHVAAYVEPLPANRFRRLPRLADWAQRILLLRHAGTDTVYVPQTWSVRETAGGKITEPKEEFLVLRTIADVIGDAEPGPVIHLGGSVQCLAFHDGESSVLAMWDSQDPPEGSSVPLQLGPADRQIDLWARSARLPSDEKGRRIVPLSPMPILIPDVPRWLIDFRTSFALIPRHVESGRELVLHTLEIASRAKRTVSGRVQLGGPESWGISPRGFNFSLMPRQRQGYPVEVRYPHNESAGRKHIVTRITLSGEGYYLEIPLPIDIGLTGIDVWGGALIENGDLILRHVVTNQSSQVVSFRGSANIPGRERQYRPFFNLQPGDTQTVEYRFRGGQGLAGRRVRLVLREMSDGPRSHNLELTVP